MARRNDWRFNDESLTTVAVKVSGRALGQKRDLGMNRTETQFSEHLELRRQVGEILWWAYEGMSFKIGERCYYTPDFDVMLSTCELQIFDVKGTQTKQSKAGVFYETDYTEDDARVKMTACAALYPLPFYIAYLDATKNWVLKEVKP